MDTWVELIVHVCTAGLCIWLCQFVYVCLNGLFEVLPLVNLLLV